MIAHLTNPAVVSGRAVVTAGGLLHATVLSLSATTGEPPHNLVRVRQVSSTSRNASTVPRRY